MNRPPFIDEHSVQVGAPAPVVWRAMLRSLPDPPPLFLRLLGAEFPRSSGDFPETGATIPGFAVTESVPDRLLRLTGRHHFSRYELVLELTPQPERTRLAALSYGEFPGPIGFLYGLAVVGSGAHAVLVPYLLRRIARRAEHRR